MAWALDFLKGVATMKWILETSRLQLRELNQQDFEGLSAILADSEVMYAWEHAFNPQQVQEWLDRNLQRYRRDGFGSFAAIEKSTGALVGVIGLLVEHIEDKDYIGVAYILNKSYWGQGYATEGAKACVDYAFGQLGCKQVVADIRPQNMASRKVAERLGMHVVGEYIKVYNNKQMPHLIYSITPEYFS